jgi:hypothetical protein
VRYRLETETRYTSPLSSFFDPELIGLMLILAIVFMVIALLQGNPAEAAKKEQSGPQSSQSHASGSVSPDAEAAAMPKKEPDPMPRIHVYQSLSVDDYTQHVTVPLLDGSPTVSEFLRMLKTHLKDDWKYKAPQTIQWQFRGDMINLNTPDSSSAIKLLCESARQEGPQSVYVLDYTNTTCGKCTLGLAGWGRQVWHRYQTPGQTIFEEPFVRGVAYSLGVGGLSLTILAFSELEKEVSPLGVSMNLETLVGVVLCAAMLLFGFGTTYVFGLPYQAIVSCSGIVSSQVWTTLYPRVKPTEKAQKAFDFFDVLLFDMVPLPVLYYSTTEDDTTRLGAFRTALSFLWFIKLALEMLSVCCCDSSSISALQVGIEEERQPVPAMTSPSIELQVPSSDPADYKSLDSRLSAGNKSKRSKKKRRSTGDKKKRNARTKSASSTLEHAAGQADSVSVVGVSADT